MTIDLIEDHVTRGLDRLLQRYKESPNLNGLLSSLMQPLQEIENQAYKLYTERSIYTAIGFQLDGIGKIVGLEREDRDDEDYRAALIIQIQINKAGGEPESIITAIRQLYKTEEISYADVYPANYEVHFISGVIIENAKALINSISPAGVGNIVLLQTMNTPFCLQEVNLVEFNYTWNNSDDLYIDTENTLAAVNEGVVKTCSGFGFVEVYLNEALYSNNGEDIYVVNNDNDALNIVIKEANEDYRLGQNGGIMAEVLN